MYTVGEKTLTNHFFADTLAHPAQEVEDSTDTLESRTEKDE